MKIYKLIVVSLSLVLLGACGSQSGMRYSVGRSEDKIKHLPYFVPYASGFSSSPIVLAGMQTTDGGDTSTLRTVQNEADGMHVMVEEEQSRDSELKHTTEVAGYISLLNQ